MVVYYIMELFSYLKVFDAYHHFRPKIGNNIDCPFKLHHFQIIPYRNHLKLFWTEIFLPWIINQDAMHGSVTSLPVRKLWHTSQQTTDRKVHREVTLQITTIDTEFKIKRIILYNQLLNRLTSPFFLTVLQGVH